MNNKPKSYEQLKCIWALAHQMNLSPDDLRARVQELYPETEGHLSRLTTDQAAHIINIFKQKLGQPRKPYKFGRQPRDEPRPYMSPAQHNMAVSLAIEIEQKKTGKRYVIDEAWALLNRLARQNQAPKFDQCNTRQAAHVIEALKEIKNRLLQSTLDKS